MMDAAVLQKDLKDLIAQTVSLQTNFSLVYGSIETLRYVISHPWAPGEMDIWLGDAKNKKEFQRLLSSPEAAGAIASNETLMTIIVGSAAAMQIVFENYSFVRAVAEKNLAMRIIAASNIAMSRLCQELTAFDIFFGSSIAMNAFVDSQTALDAIFANALSFNAFKSSKALEADSVPVMTSPTTPYGVVTASSVSSGVNVGTNMPWRVFTLPSGGYWFSGSGQITNQWIAYEFVSPVFIFMLECWCASSDYVNSFRVEVSDNGVDWATVFSGRNPPGWKGTYFFAKAGRYRHWRFYMVDKKGNNNYMSHVGLNFLGFK